MKIFHKRTKRQDIESDRAQMDSDRAPFVPLWKELSDNFSPARQRFNLAETIKASRSNSKIIDSTPVQAKNILRAGKMGGITSPARPWFKYSTQDPELSEWGAVKRWLWDVQTIISGTFNRSNLYSVLPNMYGDNGTFGTSPIGVFEKFDDQVMHNECYPIGSYRIAQDEYGRVNVFSRDFRYTVGQLVSRFGKKKADGSADWSNFSQRVRQAYEAGNYQTKVDIHMWVGPNRDFIPYSPWSINKPFIAAYHELSCGGSPSYNSQEGEIFLSEQGYDYFPILCARWEKNDEDAYGVDCPGMTTLGDARQLQLGERRILEAVERKNRPPMIAPTSMRGKENIHVPGSTTYMDLREGMQGIRSAYDINFDITEMEVKQAQCRQRIDRGWYADLFLMLSNMEQRDRTAYEIAERKEEKLLALGPVLEMINGDVLDPYMDIAFHTHLKRGLLPPIPEELRGQQLKIEYTSVTAQAQKLIGISSMDRFIQSFQVIASIDPRAVRKIKADQVVDIYADILSVDPNAVRTDDEVAEIDRQEAAQIQQQNQMAMMQQGADTAQKLATTPTSGDNALNDLLAMAQAGQ